MAPSRLSLGLLIGCSAALAAVYACQDDGVVGPRNFIQADLEPVPPDSGAGLGSYTLPTPPNNNVGYAEANTGIPLPPGLIVRVTVHGTLTFIRNPDYVNCINQGHFNMGYLPGGLTSIGPGGDQGTYAVTVGKWYGSSTASGNLLKPADATSDSAFANIGVSASGYTVFAGRPTVWLLTCSTNGQNSYPGYSPVTGSQTVTATVLPPPAITVNRTTVVSGDTVSATLSASWTTNVDAYYAYWQWIADTGATGGGASFVSGSGCGYGTLTCRVIVHGDGHLQVPNVNLDGTGIYQTAVSPTIHVAPAHLMLTVDSSHVASGSQVKFTGHRGDAKPLQVHTWVWTPGSSSPVGPLAAECAGGDSVCTTVIQNTSLPDSTGVAQTGTMTAVAYIGTAAESASAAVTVDPPLPGGGCGAAPMAAASLGPMRSGARTAVRSNSNTLIPLYGGAQAAPTGTRTTQLSPSLTRPLGAHAIQMICQPPPGDTAVFTLTVDKLTLAPRIRADSVNGTWDPGRDPDTANVTATVTTGGRGVSGAYVWFSAAFLPNTGGHAHVTTQLRFEDSPPATTGPEAGRPLVGYFLSGSQKVPYIGLTTDSTGSARLKVVAGYLGGRARVSATVSSPGTGQATTKTDTLSYAIPGLVTLKGIVPDSVVYWIGGTPGKHPQGVNFYVQDSIKGRLTPIADSLLKTVNSVQLFSQFNDGSLVNGGTFTVSPPGWTFEDPYNANGGHLAHNNGLDIDIGLCYVAYNGDDGQVHRLGFSSCTNDATFTVNSNAIAHFAACYHGVAQAHGEKRNNVFVATHYHIRFIGSSDNVPGC